MRKNLLVTAIFMSVSIVNAQEKFSVSQAMGGAYPMEKSSSEQPCVSEKQYMEMEREMTENCKRLNVEVPEKKGGGSTSFNWPVQASSSLTDCDHYSISNYVDQDITAGIQDYNCGTVTYNGHKGLDIFSWPYSFYKMDHDQVEVIAAAGGTIIAKADGNFDRNCSMNGQPANYVTVLHADGSRALYLHMKKNSVTSKTVGQTVITGEFLGVVGSSGISTGPHLHFEVWTGPSSGSYIDPYSGTCNLLNSATWWGNQKPYTEPALLAVQVNSQIAQLPNCPATEIPNAIDCIAPGTPGFLYIFLRNETIGLVKDMKVLGPNSYSLAWNNTSTTNYQASYWYWNFNATTPGTYTFEATYNNTKCSKIFYVGCTTVDAGDELATKGNLTVARESSHLVLNYQGLENSETTVRLMSVNGHLLHTETFTQDASAFTRRISSADLPAGIYLLISDTQHGRLVRKLVVETR